MSNSKLCQSAQRDAPLYENFLSLCARGGCAVVFADICSRSGCSNEFAFSLTYSYLYD